MQRATITIKEIYPPNGKGPSRILDGSGNYWKVWADVLDQLNLKKGFTYDIGYKADTYNGKPDNTIKGAMQTDAGTKSVAEAASSVLTSINGQHKTNSYNNNPGAAVMGVVNQFVGIGVVKPFEHGSLSKLIDWVEGEYAQSKLGIPF